jgi:hypothetical protein
MQNAPPVRRKGAPSASSRRHAWRMLLDGSTEPRSGGAFEQHTVSGWHDSIVMLMDLIGVKRPALDQDSGASTLMRSFHGLIRKEMTRGLEALDHAYV